MDLPLFAWIDRMFVNLSVKVGGNKIKTSIVPKSSPFSVYQHLYQIRNNNYINMTSRPIKNENNETGGQNNQNRHPKIMRQTI